MPANDCVPFFASDYRGDPNVETLSYAGKGLWAEMFILMMMTGGIFSYAGKPISETDYALIAKATRGDVKDVRRIMPEVKSSGVYSVTEDGIIYSRKLVELFAKKAKKSAAGAKGGQASAQANAQARAAAELLKQTLEQERQAHTTPTHTSSPSAREDAGARTRETAKKSPAFGFAEWYLHAAVNAGSLGGHHAQDVFAWCYGQLDAAETLIGSYGELECRKKAQRFLTPGIMPWLRQSKDIRALAKFWDARELAQAPDDEFKSDVGWE